MTAPRRPRRPFNAPNRTAAIKRLRGALQAARAKHGWDDATYYGRLSSIVGRPITSTAQLDRAECARCLDDINGNKRHQPSRDSRTTIVAAIKQRIATGIGADGEPLTMRYAEAVLSRQRGILDPAVACPIEADGRVLATAVELRGIVAALDGHAQRMAARQTLRNQER